MINMSIKHYVTTEAALEEVLYIMSDYDFQLFFPHLYPRGETFLFIEIVQWRLALTNKQKKLEKKAKTECKLVHSDHMLLTVRRVVPNIKNVPIPGWGYSSGIGYVPCIHEDLAWLPTPKKKNKEALLSNSFFSRE